MTPADNTEDVPTPRLAVTRRRFLGMAAGGAAVVAAGAGAVGAGCSSGRHGPPPTSRPSASTTTAAAHNVRIGYVAEVTGPNSARGELVKASFDALQGYINNKLGGAYRGVTLELIPVDGRQSAADGQQAYARLSEQKVDAVLWCSPFGLLENLPVVSGESIPVISVMTDIHSYVDTNRLPLTGSGAKGSVVFQTALPDVFAVDVQLAYAADDRGFASVGLLFDRAAYPHVDELFAASAAKHGLTAAAFAYDSSSGRIDLNGPLQALKHAATHVVMVYGLADQASTIASQLQTLDAAYVDTPMAKLSFKPMVMGARWGTGDPIFPRLAGDAARRGTLSTAALGSVITLPSFPMRTWLRSYRPDYNAGFPQGGEDGPADAAALIMDAVIRAGSTKSADVINALESGAITTFASSVGLSFTGDRHLAVSRDDTALLSLEFPPAPYNVGNEWREVVPKGYTGPTHLVDFTLAANTRAHATTVVDILQRRYGSSAADEYQGGDRAKVLACKKVH